METNVAQRWRERRSSYRPAGETIVTSQYEVAAIADDNTPKAFVLEHHYAGTWPAARFRFGLYRAAALVGVAVFSVPANDKVLACLPGAAIENVELGRLVLLDDVPANGESWMVARCFEELRREGLVGVVSFSDPVERRTAAGERVFLGHCGTVYQSLNAIYLGLGTPRTLRLLPDAKVFSARAAQKIRTREQGWRYSAALLERHGATPLTEAEDSGAWLARWRAMLTRAMRHKGNHKYAWCLNPRDRRHLPKSKKYPKLTLVPTRDVPT